MLKLMVVKPVKKDLAYKANGVYKTDLVLDEESLVSFSKKGNIIIHKDEKHGWVTLDDKEFESLFLVEKEYFVDGVNERDFMLEIL